MCRILVIDDDSLQRTTLRVCLEKLGHEIRAAESGVKALKIMNEDAFLPALVITDMVMPDMDGLEVIQYFHTHHPDIPLIAISGEVPDSYLQLAKRLGARAAMAKPIRLERLQEILEEILGTSA